MRLHHFLKKKKELSSTALKNLIFKIQPREKKILPPIFKDHLFLSEHKQTTTFFSVKIPRQGQGVDKNVKGPDPGKGKKV